jgi:hypothetical protein
MQFIESITGKSKLELKELAKTNILNLRIWIQEHGEQALLIGVLLGLFFALAFKFAVIFLLIIGAISAFIWFQAPN